MLESCLLGQLEWYGGFEKLNERRVSKVSLDQLVGREVTVAGVYERPPCFFIRVNFGDAALVLVGSHLEFGKKTRIDKGAVTKRADDLVDDNARIRQQGEQRDRESRALIG